jgi:hypothetical protein
MKLNHAAIPIPATAVNTNLNPRIEFFLAIHIASRTPVWRITRVAANL